MTNRLRLRLSCLVGALLVTTASAQDGIGSGAAAWRLAISGAGQGYVVDEAGLTRSGRPIATLEPIGVPGPARRKLVVVGGLDGNPDSMRAVLAFVRWWMTDRAAEPLRHDWQIGAMPCALPDRCETSSRDLAPPIVEFPPTAGFFNAVEQAEARFVWRWIAMQAPDLVVEIGSRPSSLVAALGSGTLTTGATAKAVELAVTERDVVSAVRRVLEGASADRASPLRRVVETRVARTPLDVARLMASRYPANPIMSYIPALSWSGAIRLSKMTGDPRYAERARAQMAPFLAGEKPAIAEPYLLTSLAGHQAFADLDALIGDPAAGALARRAADFILSERPDEIVRFRTTWTDDMFMATSVLARAASRTGEAAYWEAIERLLTWSIATLQRPDGLFVHAQAGPHAWGRGNGFAAFGLVEALTHLPDDWTGRPRVLDAYRRHMKGMAAHQAADGMWRQMVDEHGSYRELTVTAMTAAAMARGLRRGWLDASFRPVVDRAWRGLLARVGEDGALLDVCTGTGAGATKQYYLDRAAVAGADDRGGAMVLTAALEIAELTAAQP